MPAFFIERPIFAWVVTILICIAGSIALANIGVESYPDIAPPQITVTATYPGASAKALEESVTQIIEQQLTGIDHLLYFSSTSASNGQATITLTFENGVNPDIAQVQVQNKVGLATTRLPKDVVQQGVIVAKANNSFLMAVALRSSNPHIDSADLNDIVGTQVIDQIARIPGVGNVRQFGGEYSMNIWLDPEKLQGYGLSPAQVYAAITNQNAQFSAGAIGSDPAPKGQTFTATVSAEGRFNTPEQFKNIILRSDSNGAIVRLKDVARVTIGSATYGIESSYNDAPVGAFAIQLLPGANALNIAQAVREKMKELQVSFPKGVDWFTPFDSTSFVKISIEEVVETLVEAIVLVFFVMLVFLQNFRATIIPTLVIPVALLGTFIGMKLIGFTINQLTLFAMVLAIGIIVDDAIVVIENVERIMRNEKLEAKEATLTAMRQITGAIIAITVVLAAVFVPSALQPGASGQIYKQFALTIAIAMAFSAFLGLTFTPALCAMLLKQHGHDHVPNFVFRWFNTIYGYVQSHYLRLIRHTLKHIPLWLVVFVVISATAGFLMKHLPTSFLPEEDQGFIFSIVQLPPGSTIKQTEQVLHQMREATRNIPEIEGMLQVKGFSFLGVGENVGMAFIKLKPWNERKRTALELIPLLNGIFYQIRGAQIFAVNMPTIQGLGQFGGFDFWLQDRSGKGEEALTQARNMLLFNAQKQPQTMVAVRPNALEDAPELQLHVDRLQAQSMGVSIGDVYNTVQMLLAPVYVNDFLYEGRIKRVTMRADAPFRTSADSLKLFFVPSTTQTQSNGLPKMIPLDSVISEKWDNASPSLTRFNGYASVEIVGNVPPGGSSGQAMKAITTIVDSNLPRGYGIAWAGMSYQELVAGNAATLLIIFSIVVVFLCLAALYESWAIPLSVILVLPVGLLGTVLFIMLRGLSNDIYFKIGLITVIGLAAKNAILIVEFAVEQCMAGKTLREATITAAELRFRPVLMTSFAFILGVFPLVISTGAGANSRHSIGTGVIGGMLFASSIGLLLIPLFYIVIRLLTGDRLDEKSALSQLKKH